MPAVQQFHTYALNSSGGGLFVKVTNGAEVVLDQKYAQFDWNASGSDQLVVAAVTGKRIRVVQYTVCSKAAGAAIVAFRNGISANISCEIPLAASDRFQQFFNPFGWFQTNVGTALNVRVTTNPVCGFIGYIEV